MNKDDATPMDALAVRREVNALGDRFEAALRQA
jgi:hypothetical protein